MLMYRLNPAKKYPQLLAIQQLIFVSQIHKTENQEKIIDTYRRVMNRLFEPQKARFLGKNRVFGARVIGTVTCRRRSG